MPRAAVIGGGVVGHACALALQRAGLSVTLFDPMREPSGASWGNAGHIAAEQVEPWASRTAIASAPRRLFWRGGALDFRGSDIAEWLPFSIRLIAASAPSRFERGKAALTALLEQTPGAWRRLASDLGDPGLYVENGHTIVWESGTSATAGLAQWKKTPIGNTSFQPASQGELAELSSLLRKPPAGAIHFSGTGQISDPTHLANLLAQRFATNGGERRYERIARLAVEKDRALALLEKGGRIDADVILVTAGVRSGEVLRTLGYRVPIIAERGYHIQSPVENWPLDLGPIVFEDRSLIVTRFKDTVRAASFLEFARPDTPPDPRKWERLRLHIKDLGLAIPLPGKEWMGRRPTLPDYLPAIGRSRAAQNLLYAFGHQHLGLTLSAITGEIIGALVTDAPPPVAVQPFDLERFA